MFDARLSLNNRARKFANKAVALKLPRVNGNRACHVLCQVKNHIYIFIYHPIHDSIYNSIYKSKNDPIYDFINNFIYDSVYS